MGFSRDDRRVTPDDILAHYGVLGAQWTIVAIPEPDDYVWKISSEKIPHMTLLFLGEPSDGTSVQNIVEYLQHTVNTSLRRFGLSVDRRGLLGSDNADVVFFEKGDQGYGDMKMVNEARSYLLKNDEIFKAYSNADQYPEWTPHLTLGYPEAPAKPDNRDYPGTHYVHFDRLALWTGDFVGLEIPLKSDDRMAMSIDDKVEDILAHYGVMGMHWGVRKAESVRRLASSPSNSEDYDKALALARRPARSLSNSEMRTLTQRLQLERSYVDLLKHTATISKGQTTVKDILAVAGTVNSIIAIASSPIGTIVRKAVTVAVETAIEVLKK